ncbi:MAG TPA: TfoX/Sxy family protein [Peptococcaceae bacterium]|nr:TfoX/Sxy family protein [Peptococcaceae bacterium]
MGELAKLPNIGKVLEKTLNEIGIGIYTEEQLRQIGSKEAFVRIRRNDPGACLRVLYSLQGAIDGIKDTVLPESTKVELKMFYKKLEERKMVEHNL